MAEFTLACLAVTLVCYVVVGAVHLRHQRWLRAQYDGDGDA